MEQSFDGPLPKLCLMTTMDAVTKHTENLAWSRYDIE